MNDLTSITSSATALVANQTARLKKTAGEATTSFADTLFKIETAVGIKPKTGFSAGPTYEAGTLAGQTKAALASTLTAAKSALHIKP